MAILNEQKREAEEMLNRVSHEQLWIYMMDKAKRKDIIYLVIVMNLTLNTTV